MSVAPGNGSVASMSIEYYLLILLPVMVLLSFVKNIRHLSIASTAANLLQVAALAIVVYNLVSDIPPVTSLTQPYGTKIPLFFSTTVFSFEVIKVVSLLSNYLLHGMCKKSANARQYRASLLSVQRARQVLDLDGH